MPQNKAATPDLYDEIVQITYEYLGPAADRYVARQIESHLDKSPEDLQKKDLKELIDWISVTTAHLIDDAKIVNEYVAKLQKLRRAR